MNALVHQRRTVGAGAMVGMGSVVTKDVPAGEKWFGNPARFQGENIRPRTFTFADYDVMAQARDLGY
jgi:UDP-N-acetylglucosamine acyltransferase